MRRMCSVTVLDVGVSATSREVERVSNSAIVLGARGLGYWVSNGELWCLEIIIEVVRRNPCCLRRNHIHLEKLRIT